jgi:hypothetical protein
MKFMKKVTFFIVICTLLSTSIAVPISGRAFQKDASQLVMYKNVQGDDVEHLISVLQGRLNAVKTKQDILLLIRETIMDLQNYGLLPKEMSRGQVQRFMTGLFLKSRLFESFQRPSDESIGNSNCLVIGITDQTYFRPYPALVMDVPFLNNLAFNSSFRNITCFLAVPYLFRVLQPFKVGPYAYIGGRVKEVEHENITDKVFSASGLVLTFGSNGLRKWNGSFYGGLYTKYEKFSYNNYSSLELWDSVGIDGFIGVNFLSVASLNQNVPMVYIGFAREVNFSYSPPWRQENT